MSKNPEPQNEEKWSLHPGETQRKERGITTKAQQLLAKTPVITQQTVFESPALRKKAFYADSTCLILQADVSDALGWLKEAGLFVDCIVTSPPFYGQRDYAMALT